MKGATAVMRGPYEHVATGIPQTPRTSLCSIFSTEHRALPSSLEQEPREWLQCRLLFHKCTSGRVQP